MCRSMTELLVDAAPPSADTWISGLSRSIVVCVRLPTIEPCVHELDPSGKNRLSLWNEILPWAQMPYWEPCCRLATPDQLAQAPPLGGTSTDTGSPTAALLA